MARIVATDSVVGRRSRLRRLALAWTAAYLARLLPRSGAARRLVQGVVVLGVALFGVAQVVPYPAERLSYEELVSTRLLDRHGRFVHEQRGRSGAFMQPVELDAVAESVVLATLSSEDAAFYYHPGVDPIGVARAMWLNVREGRWAYGGSTITQQLAKRIDPQSRDLAGKLQEAWDAWRLELVLSKRELLTQYLNRVYYGRMAVGIEAAAHRYYGKSARELTLDEGALLAILPRAPSFYDPEQHPDRALARRAHVLGKMAQRGWITVGEARLAAAVPIRFVPQPTHRSAPHVVDLVMTKRLVPTSEPRQSLTIDLELQRAIEQRVRLHLDELERFGATQAGVVVIENATGDVLAMVGSRRYGERAVSGSVNATTSLRTPGSTLKPFVYAVAIEQGAHPSSLVLDVPTHFRGYQPRSFRSFHHGSVPMREALGSSLNVPAVRTAAVVGVERVARLLHDSGLSSLEPEGRHGLPLALGGVSVSLLELASAYATLARGGVVVAPRFFLDAEVVAGRRVIGAETAFLVADALADPTARRREFGFETPFDLPFPVAAKTGTSQAYCDNVAIGFTPDVTVAVWVGNFDGTPMRGLLAMEGAAPLWREAMLRVHRERPPREFVAPPGVTRVDICSATGLLAGADCRRTRTEYVRSADLIRGSLIGMLTVSGNRVADEEHVTSVRIVAPPDGGKFVIDPLLPRDRQRILLRASVIGKSEARVRWFVDGQPVAESDERRPVHWTLQPGRFRLRAEVVGTNEVFDEVGLEVKG